MAWKQRGEESRGDERHTELCGRSRTWTIKGTVAEQVKERNVGRNMKMTHVEIRKESLRQGGQSNGQRVILWCMQESIF